jgi:hypothetical protein
MLHAVNRLVTTALSLVAFEKSVLRSALIFKSVRLLLLLSQPVLLLKPGSPELISLVTVSLYVLRHYSVLDMNVRGGWKTKIMATAVILLHLPTALSYHHSPPANAVPTLNVDAIFQHTTSRNYRVITQAVDFVVSMQTAPTCTRMAASHLMNECKLLEHAPDFAKARPEAYLDNVKTEYAAKLAVCELLSAQPINPTPPPNCEILVPSSKACSKGGRWWYTNPEVLEDKQCYPAFKEYQYTQCLKSLQSTPQFWTSFSNARQNAVVMCQASRDAIERENHLETFKNLTQVLGEVTSTMQKSTEDYESLIREQRQYSNEARESHDQLKSDVQAIQEKAIATVTVLDDKFHAFMGESMTQLITALANNQNAEIERVQQRMQDFSQDLMAESSQLAQSFTNELERYHELALLGVQTNHQAQVESYNILSNHMGVVQDTVNKTNDVAGASLTKIDSIAQRLDTFESQTEHIAEGFAFLSAIPALVTIFVRGFIAIIGVLFLFATIYRCNRRLATYTTGACSAGFLLHACGIFHWLGELPSRIDNFRAQPSLFPVANLSTTQKGMAIVLVLWLGAYPIVRINSYLATLLETAIHRFMGPLWVHQYENEGGMGLLPSIEIPAAATSGKHKSSLGRGA